MKLFFTCDKKYAIFPEQYSMNAERFTIQVEVRVVAGKQPKQPDTTGLKWSAPDIG